MKSRERAGDERRSSRTIEAPSLDLAKGGGALKSIDDTFAVNAANGTATLAVTLPLSAARLTPSVSLHYDSGNGAGAFGLGWMLQLPSIARGTDKRLPRYHDGDDSDDFVIAGAEALVPLLRDDGTIWETTDGTSRIRRYRPRIDGTFALVERVSPAGQPFYWRVTTPANVTTIFGSTEQTRIADPADATRVFRWLPALEHDDKGNVIVYEYKSETGAASAGVQDRNRYDDLGRPRFTQRYLKRVRYGNRTPWFASSIYAPEPPDAGFSFELLFDFGEHEAVDAISHDEANAWNERTDAFSDYRPGFELRTLRLCRRVAMFHHFDELGAPYLVRSLDLEYASSALGGITYLAGASVRGYTRRADGGYDSTVLPTHRFTYQESAWNHTVATLDAPHTPVGVIGSYQLVDLWNEGIAGILSEHAGALYYRRNLGGGELAGASALSTQPSFTGLGAGALRVADLGADGGRQLVSSAPAGYFELDANAWHPFVAFEQSPTTDVEASNVLRIDLDGDGRSELLVTEHDVVRWYPSLGRAGYAPAETTVGARDEEHGPVVLWNDEHQRVFLADVVGDGVATIVRVRNGEVCYWPNLGYGRFGDKVTMGNAPSFAAPDAFDPRRLVMADLTGTGASDLVYLDGARVTLWLNQSGNAWSAPHELVLPEVPLPEQFLVGDVLGTGTPCLVWSSPLPSDAHAPLRYVDLFGGMKPHLLQTIENGLGARSTISYRCSTAYYLEDARAGRPWRTVLPFPVHCISRIEKRDTVTDAIHVSEYAYHHGYYDKAERELRGFACVDQIDSESFTRWRRHDASNVVEERLHQPVALTRTWFHTGAEIDVEAWHRADELPPVDEPALTIALPSGLAPGEYRDALRACKSAVLRTEVFVLDAPPDATAEQRLAELTPTSVAQTGYRVVREQPTGPNRHAVFRTESIESLHIVYERRIDDPRVAHELVLETDRYGNVLASASIAYARRTTPADMPARAATAQSTDHVTITRRRFTDDELTAAPAPYRLPELCETRTFERTIDVTGRLLTADDFTIDGDERLLSHHRTFYLADDLSSPRAFGKASPLGLIQASYKLALTPEILRAAIDSTRLPDAELDAVLVGEGRYVAFDDGWWIGSGTVDYLDATRAPQRFFQPASYIDPRGHRTIVEYLGEDATRVNASAHWNVVALRRDAVGNEIRIAAFDFRLLAASEVIDANGNREAVVFDDLGRVIANAVMGKGDQADNLDVLQLRLGDRVAQADQIAALLETADRDAAAWLLADATTRFIYDVSSIPARSVSIAREHHARDLEETGDPLRLQLAFEYTGGAGTVAMKKVQAADNRWIGNGRTVLNNKGLPVKKFEPYFSSTHAFEAELLLVDTGVSPEYVYDALGRMLRVDHPDGSFETTSFDAWRTESRDRNDNVAQSRWHTERIALPSSDPRRIAAEQTLVHDNTPNVVFLDPLGREICEIEHRRSRDATDTIVDAFPTTHITLDLQGNLLSLTDARGNIALEQRYDLAGRPLYARSIDRGERWAIADVADAPIVAWTSRGIRSHHLYDPLHRELERRIAEAGGPERVAIVTRWGEGAPDATARNLRGKPWRVYYQAGLEEVIAYDHRGNQIESRRRYTRDHDGFVAWSLDDLDAPLDTETFDSRARYDVLGRPVELVTPDGSRTAYAYDDGARLTRVEARGQTLVDSITYNAKGQRLAIIHGNGARTEHTYDPVTSRIATVLTTRGSDRLQDLAFVFDPVGNLIACSDAAQPTHYFAGAVATPNRSYAYDSLYQLVRARGREHIGQNVPASEWDLERSRHVLPGDGQAMQMYEQRYDYDLGGNLVTLAHAASSGGQFENRWTRTYGYGATTNQLSSTTVGNTTVAYTHDEQGNMLAMPHVALTWDALDCLHAAEQGTTRTIYGYDEGGDRVRKVVEKQGGLREVRLYFGAYEVFRRFRNNALVLERQSLHVRDGEKRIALVETRTVGDEDAPAQLVRYQLSDHLDSAVLELDGAAAVISYEEYHPFGTTAWQAGRTAAEVSLKRYRYSGMERDEETGLGYHGARYYAPWLGRWTSADPEGLLDGANLYAYARNNPVVLHDVTGTQGRPGSGFGKFEKCYKEGKGPPKPQVEEKPQMELRPMSGTEEPTVKATLGGKTVYGTIDDFEGGAALAGNVPYGTKIEVSVPPGYYERKEREAKEAERAAEREEQAASRELYNEMNYQFVLGPTLDKIQQDLAKRAIEWTQQQEQAETLRRAAQSLLVGSMGMAMAGMGGVSGVVATVAVTGTPQKTRTPGHDTRSEAIGDYWLTQPGVTGIAYNQTYTVGTQGMVVSNLRPDVLTRFGVEFVNTEVLSPSENIVRKTHRHMRVMKDSSGRSSLVWEIDPAHIGRAPGPEIAKLRSRLIRSISPQYLQYRVNQARMQRAPARK